MIKILPHARIEHLQPTHNETYRFVAHVVNNKGRIGAGVSEAICKRWPVARRAYQDHGEHSTYNLGDVIYAYIPEDLVVVAALCAQDGFPSQYNKQPLSYNALFECLGQLNYRMQDHLTDLGGYPELHIPRLGCGLSGGYWDVVQTALQTFIKHDCPIFVYDPDPEEFRKLMLVRRSRLKPPATA